VVRNYEGLISTYVQPTEYQPHNPATCAFCQSKRGESGQDGVASLLSGRNLTIAPEGWRGLHQRATVPQITMAEASVPQNGHNGYATNGSQMLQFARFQNGKASREPDDKR
jgi:hypothetical protein